MIRHIGGHMPIAMEESSNYECSESHQSGGFFAVTKERRALMYAKLDKLREDLKKAVAKREAADAKVKQLEAKLKEEENQQIVSDVASYNLSPEQLAQFLQLANSGRLQEMLSGQVPMPGAVAFPCMDILIHFFLPGGLLSRIPCIFFFIHALSFPKKQPLR